MRPRSDKTTYDFLETYTGESTLDAPTVTIADKFKFKAIVRSESVSKFTYISISIYDLFHIRVTETNQWKRIIVHTHQ